MSELPYRLPAVQDDDGVVDDSNPPGVDRLLQMAPERDELTSLLPGSPLAVSVNERKPPSTIATSGAHSQEAWHWEHTESSRVVLLELFMMIDKVGDSSGTVCSTELMHMMVNLGEDVADDTADKMVDLIDTNGSGEIEFDEFYAVMTGQTPLHATMARSPGETRHQVSGSGRSIREIRALFNEIDDDDSGYLDKHEVSDLAAKMGTELNRRHLIDAMRAMDPTNSGEVTFEMFRNWLVDTRDGRHWADFLVLPEGAVAAIRELADISGSLDALEGSGASGIRGISHPMVQWMRLSILLKVMAQTTSLWGTPHTMYLTPENKSVYRRILKMTYIFECDFTYILISAQLHG